MAQALATAGYQAAPKGRGATVVVAAHNTPARAKRNADFICTGTDDQNVINAAIALLDYTGDVDVPGKGEVTYKNQGGRVHLLAGSYIDSGPIDMSGINDITLSGDGTGTVIYNTATDGSHAIQAINTNNQSNKSRPCVRDLMVIGNPDSGDGVRLEDCDYQHLFNVHALANGAHGIHIVANSEAAGAENKVIDNCYALFNGLDGIRIEDSTHETLITGCHMEENYRYGLSAEFAIDLHVANCSIEDNYGEYGVHLNRAAQTLFANVTLEGDIYIAVSNAGNYVQRFSNCSLGSVDYTRGSSGGVLYLSNSTAVLRDVDAQMVEVAGGFARIHKLSVVQHLTISGAMVILDKQADESDGLIEVGDTMSVSGGYVESQAASEIKITASNARVNFNGVNLRNFRPAFTVGADLSSARLQLSGCNMRTSEFSVDGVHIVHLGGNMMIGAATMTFENITGLLNVNGNTLQTVTFSIADSCQGAKIGFLKNLRGSSVVVNDSTNGEGTTIDDV